MPHTKILFKYVCVMLICHVLPKTFIGPMIKYINFKLSYSVIVDFFYQAYSYCLEIVCSKFICH